MLGHYKDLQYEKETKEIRVAEGSRKTWKSRYKLSHYEQLTSKSIWNLQG